MPTRATTADQASLRLLLPLLLLFVGLRGFIPAGWMPSFDHAGMSLVPCSGWTAPETVAAAHSGHDMQAMHHGDPAPQHDGKAKHDVAGQPCAFAASAVDLPQPNFAPAIQPQLLAEPFLLPLLTVRIGRGLAAPPPPQTGPPLTA